MHYTKRTRARPCVGVALLILLLAAAAADAQWATQTLSLTQGWNAVFLNVDPEPSSCDAVFGQRPRILSVRRWAPLSPDDVQYDESAGTILPNGGSWLTWFPSNSVNRVLLNMAETAGGAAYLIEVSAGGNVPLSVSGHPLAIAHSWLAGSHQFLGLPVPAAPAVNFTTFFAPVTNDIPVDYRLGGEIYRVKSDGTHERIYQPTLTSIVPGQACWIKSAGRVEYSGPVGVLVESAGAWMDFGSRPLPQYVVLKNETGAARGVTLRTFASGAPPAGQQTIAGQVPLRYAAVQPLEGVLGRTYRALPATWTTQIQGNASLRLALIPDAAQMTSTDLSAAYQSILEVTDSASTILQRFGVRAATRSGTVTDAKGLWVGAVSITDVGRLQMLGVLGVAPVSPAPVARPFVFRLIAHVTTNGTVRLLQRALVGTRYDSQTGEVITDILADESNVAVYKAAHPDGKVFRVSSANFPFMDPLTLTGGTFGMPNQSLRGTVAMTRDDPVNPFRHSYAAMHDNLEQRAENRVAYTNDVEVYSVRRAVELLFKPADESNPDPRWGATVCGGIYSEDVYGLGGPVDASNRLIKVKGTFRLERALPAGALTM